MLSSTITKISILFISVFLAFGFTNTSVNKPKKQKYSKTIVDKIEQNLLLGWSITHIDENQEQFSEKMKTLGFTYGLTLVNEQLPIILKTENGHQKEYPELKIIVSTLDKQEKMKAYVQQKAKSGTFHHCFIAARKHLLTVIWTESNVAHIDKRNQKELMNFGDNSKYQKSRRKFIKQLNWYFEMY